MVRIYVWRSLKGAMAGMETKTVRDVLVMLGLLTGKGAFLYPPAGEPRSELIRRRASVNRRS
jgi:hypothetical protein